jgi:hypothetical protein
MFSKMLRNNIMNNSNKLRKIIIFISNCYNRNYLQNNILSKSMKFKQNYRLKWILIRE